MTKKHVRLNHQQQNHTSPALKERDVASEPSTPISSTDPSTPTLFSTLTYPVTATLATLSSTASHLSHSVTDTATANLDYYKDRLHEGYQYAREHAPTPVVQSVDWSVEKVTEAKDVVEKTKEAVQERVTATKEVVQGKVTATKEAVQERVTATKEVVQDKVMATKEAVQERVQATTGYVFSTTVCITNKANQYAQAYLPTPVYGTLERTAGVAKTQAEYGYGVAKGVASSAKQRVDGVTGWTWSTVYGYSNALEGWYSAKPVVKPTVTQ